jgi:glutathione S-transferase
VVEPRTNSILVTANASDLILTSLFRYFGLDIERPSLPHVQAWYDRLQERQAYRDHVIVPFTELRGRLDY